ncbi:hypothetical protein F511_10272 [Dorcoceras hygrometricum]|uniref:Uncharacterized protein n=1 Tax=Dorcoceras hygrometricum TaxID=472368 RepID=A0A2Z7ABF4_9LAMI|nr:hypothetical protein F511_10272 [Dorcoceras hygrometricum]
MTCIACLEWSRREDIQARTVMGRLSWTGRRYLAGTEQHEDQAQYSEEQNDSRADQVQSTSAKFKCSTRIYRSFQRDFGGQNEGIWPKSGLCHDIVMILTRRTVLEGVVLFSCENIKVHPEPCIFTYLVPHPDYKPATEASWYRYRSELDEENIAAQQKSSLVEKRPAQWTDQLIAKKK